MNVLEMIFPVFCFLIGIPFLLIPQKVQGIVLAFNERLGHKEDANSFRRSEDYVSRLRSAGLTAILGGIVVIIIELYAEDIVRVFM